MKRLLPLLLTFIAASAAAQQRPVPDPRLDVALSTTVIKETQRSVEFHRTMPQRAVRAASDDPNAVRVRPSDR